MTENQTIAEDRQLTEAVAIANIPTLLMVLVQLTGERKWLSDPYRPTRARGLSDNDDGGLPESIQSEIRDAALEAILSWRSGRPVALPEPPADLLVEMLACAMGEPVGREYGPMIAAQLGVRPVDADASGPVPVPEGFHVVVIGAGASGLCAGHSLKQAGIPFTIIEKQETVGGVWLENRYPGAGVDTPNHLYSFSFAPYDWKMYFCLRDELHGYMEHVADTFDLRSSIRFQTQVVSATFDGDAQDWAVVVRNRDGSAETLRANVVISGVGIFNPLKMPDIPGLDTFEGPSFHTNRWPADVDLHDKKVAMIGNGASAMQTGPEIQPIVENLTIFQRSQHWAAPFEQFRKPVPDSIRLLFNEVPLYRMWYRMRLGWLFNDRLHPALQKDPTWEHPERSLNSINDGHRAYFARYIEQEIGDRPELLAKVMPTYPPYGKRMLMDNGWFRMLTKDNVELVTESVTEIGPHSVTTADGTTHEADVLVLATGFDVLRFLTSYDVIGKSGRSLREAWEDDDARAYLGTVIPDFPNFFCMYGPNTQPGHGGSLIFVLEMQIRLIMDLLRKMAADNLATVEIRKDVHDEYNAAVDKAHESMVWTHPGMSTYYRNDRGRIVVNFPYRNVDLFERTERANLDEFILEPRRDRVGATAAE